MGGREIYEAFAILLRFAVAGNMFEGLTPTRLLWVSADAAPGGDGSQGAPFQTIQAALNIAGAGDAVMVRAGEYRENAKIEYSHGGGAPDAPLWIISADGPQAAHIIAPSSTTAAFTGSGAENVVVSGFHVTGGKNGIQFSQNGSDFKDMPKNIVIQDNLVDGAVADAIKVDHADNVSIIGNVLRTRDGEGVDFVAVSNSVISKNEVSGAGGAAGVMVKGGSTNVLVDSNWIHDIRADGITVGGWTSSQFFIPGMDTYEASHVEVSNNIIENVGKRPVNVLGGIYSSIHNNHLEATANYYTVIGIGSGNPDATTPMYSHDISITDNIFTRATQLVSAATGNNVNISVSGSTTAQWNESLGAQTATYEADLAWSPAAASAPAEASLAPAFSDELVAFSKVLFELAESGTYTSKFVGTQGRNTLTGTAGADWLDGRGDRDTLKGGAGDDTYVVDISADKVIEAVGGGIDTVRTGKSGAYYLANNVENLTLTGKSGQYGVGNALDNLIRSNDFGSRIDGGAGDDILVAGRGGDLLRGGSGADVFRFATVPSRAAHVTDFALSEDMIDLRPLFKNAGYVGADPVADHHLAIHSDGAGGAAIYFDADGAGAGAASVVVVIEHVDPVDLHMGSDWFFA
jgi:serralysin